jgi:hypothetical protein
LLPGINPGTVEWITELAGKLDLDIGKSRIQHYTFWSDETIQPDLSYEVSFLPDEKFDLVIGKSFGSLVLMQAHMENRLQCERAILLGIPIKSFAKRSMPKDALAFLKQDSAFVIQQLNDKFGNVSEFGVNKPANLLSIEGDDHLYDAYDLYLDDVNRWLEKKS